MSSTTNLNIDIPSGNPLPITISGDGTPVSTDVEITLNPVELKVDPLKADLTVEPLQVSTDSKISTDSTISTDSKVLSDSKSQIDLKPVALDSCTTFKLAPLPPVCVEQPYSQHFGITFMGIELWGFNLSGKSQTFMNSRSKCEERDYEDRDDRPNPPVSRPASGLRVRLK
jgi:hypothetical protein